MPDMNRNVKMHSQDMMPDMNENTERSLYSGSQAMQSTFNMHACDTCQEHLWEYFIPVLDLWKITINNET